MAKRTVETLIKAKDQTKPAVDSAGKGFGKLENTLRNNAKLIAGFSAAAVAGLTAAAAAAYKLLDSTAAMEDALAKAAKRAQVDVGTYGEWAYVLQLAGGSAGQLERAIAALSRQVLNAERGSLESVEAFESLGINVKTAAGNLKSADIIFGEVVENLSQMEDKTRRAALAQVLMGRGGKSLIPILDQTSKQLQEQRQEYRALGGDAIIAATETGEAWVDAKLRVDTALQGVRASALSAFGPEIVKLIDGVAFSIAALADEAGRLDKSFGLPSLDAFVSDLEYFATVAPASINLMQEMAETGLLLESRDFSQLPKQLLETSEAVSALQSAVIRAKDINLGLPGAGESLNELKEYNDFLKLSRKELELLAKARGVDVTGQRVDFVGVDIPRTSEAIARDLEVAVKQGVEEVNSVVAASPDTKIRVAAELEGAEALADYLGGTIVYYEDIVAAQNSVKQGSDEWLEKVTLLKAQMAQLGDIYKGLTFQLQPSDGADELTEGLDEAALAADSLGRGFGNLAVDAPFAAMTDDAFDLSKALSTTLVSAIKEVIKQLLVVKAIGFFGRLIGLKSGGQVPGNLGQYNYSEGGKIPQAAYGYSVPDGIRGQDSRLIMAMPGEEVINRQLSQRLERFITAQESAAYASPYGSGGSAGGGGNTVVLDVGITDSMAGLQRMTDAIVERLSEGGAA